jgi:hypothetical protein
MIRAFIGSAVAGLLLAGCAGPQSAATKAAAAGAPQCAHASLSTGSHIPDKTSCDNGDVRTMSATAFENHIRQNNTGVAPSH